MQALFSVIYFYCQTSIHAHYLGFKKYASILLQTTCIFIIQNIQILRYTSIQIKESLQLNSLEYKYTSIHTWPLTNIAIINLLDLLDLARKVYKYTFLSLISITFIKSIQSITAPSVALWFVNNDDPAYQALPDYRKDLFWNIRINGTYYPIAKPFEIGLIFGTGAERFLDYYLRNIQYYDLIILFIIIQNTKLI